MSTLSKKAIVAAVVVTLAVPTILAYSYQLVAGLLAWSPWLAAAVVNSVLALGVVAWQRRRLFGELDQSDLSERWAATLDWFNRRPLRPYYPAIALGWTALLVAMISRYSGGAKEPLSLPLAQIAFVLWIPVIEELVFRAGLGSCLRSQIGAFHGAWLASIAFALAHVQPTVGRWLAGDVGLVPGPFLLGLACETLIVATGRIGPAIALHVAANGTVVIFGLLDPRWLDWLRIFYI